MRVFSEILDKKLDAVHQAIETNTQSLLLGHSKGNSNALEVRREADLLERCFATSSPG